MSVLLWRKLILNWAHLILALYEEKGKVNNNGSELPTASYGKDNPFDLHIYLYPA